MNTYNWSQFIKRININASVQEVYNAWTSEEGLESWFLRKAIFTRNHKHKLHKKENILEGDSYEWNWFGYDDSIAERHTILAANGKDNLQFRFSGGCIVTVNIKKENGETICEVVQNMSPADENKRQSFYMECSFGWIFYLANLKSIMEGGVDLRNKNEEIKLVINS